MAIKYLETATVYYLASGAKKTFPSLAKARAVAEAYVGNRLAIKPFRDEPQWLYGPGNGDTSVSVSLDLDMDAFMGRAP